MVLSAVLRDPARHPEQAARRVRVVRFDPDPRLHAMARHVAGALGALPPALQAVFLAMGRGLHPARLARLQAAGGPLRHLRTHPDDLLLRVLHHHPAAARHLRKDQAAAAVDRRFRAQGRRADRRAGPAAGADSSGSRPMTMQKTLATLALAAAVAAHAIVIAQDEHSHETPPPPRQPWSFAGP